mgnify:FL=1
MNYKKIHLELTQQLQNTQLDSHSRESIQQRIHYIQTEYKYVPKYSPQQLKPKRKRR